MVLCFAYLFILAIEILLIHVRDSELVRCMPVIDKEIKLDAYADDAFFFNLHSSYVEKEDLTGIRFSSDFENAFDSVDHYFMFACLQRFGFGTQFVQWVKTLFNSAQSCVMNNRLFCIRKGYQTG